MLLIRSAQKDHRRDGMIIAFVAVCLIVVMSFVALSLDAGMMMAERRQAQAVADAAALAAAADLFENFWTNYGEDPDGTAYQSALTTAAHHGYTPGGAKTDVEIYIPPQSG